MKQIVCIIIFLLGLICLIYLLNVIFENKNTRETLDNNINSNIKINKATNRENNPLYIPKQIFQLIQDKNNIHTKLQNNIDYIKQLNSDFKYTLLDDNDMIEYLNSYYPDMVQIYNKINPVYGAARADFFRYLLMYKEGGIYLDIKSNTSVPLSQIISYDDEFILSYDKDKTFNKRIPNINGELEQWHIICKPNHPFLKKVIDDVTQNILNYNVEKDGKGKQSVLNLTGPIQYTRSIEPMLPFYKHTLYMRNEYIGLVYTCFNNPTQHRNKYSNKAYHYLNEPLVL